MPGSEEQRKDHLQVFSWSTGNEVDFYRAEDLPPVGWAVVRLPRKWGALLVETVLLFPGKRWESGLEADAEFEGGEEWPMLETLQNHLEKLRAQKLITHREKKHAWSTVIIAGSQPSPDTAGATGCATGLVATGGVTPPSGTWACKRANRGMGACVVTLSSARVPGFPSCKGQMDGRGGY